MNIKKRLTCKYPFQPAAPPMEEDEVEDDEMPEPSKKFAAFGVSSVHGSLVDGNQAIQATSTFHASELAQN